MPLLVDVIKNVALLLSRQQGPIRAGLQELKRRGLKYVSMNELREALVATGNWTKTIAEEFGEICAKIFE